jgi:hypothetical protein
MVSSTVAFADGGVLYLIPTSGIHAIGDTFDVQILADSGGRSINAAEADLAFDPEVLSVERISTDGSLLQSWPTPVSFSNDTGSVTFSGLINGKYTGTNGLLITVTFRALRNIESKIRLASGAILAADGLETNIITSMRSAVFTIQPKELPAAPTDAALSADGTTTLSTTATDTTIPTPVFVNFQNEVTVGDRIVIKGTAPAGTTVSMRVQQGANKEKRVDIETDSTGTFTYTSDTEAQEGVYYISAYTLGDHGTQSESSPKITITAGSAGVAAAAQFEASLISDILPFLALVVFAGLGLAYFSQRRKLAKVTFDG